MSEKTTFFKNTGLYFIGNSLSKIVAFFLLPVYSKYLSPEEFGYFDLTQSYIFLAIPIITCETYLGMMRFVSNQSNRDRIPEIVFSGLVLFLFSFACIVLLLLFRQFFSDIRFFVYILFLTLVFIVQRYVVYLCRGLGYNKLFVLSGIISSLVIALSNYIMIVYYGMGIESMYLSTIIGTAYQIVHILIVVKIHQYVSFNNFDFRIFKGILFFSLPLSVGSILYFFLNYYNRLIIESKLGLSANGHFAIAGKFGMIIMFLTSAFTMAWQDFSFSREEHSERLKTFSLGIHKYNQFLMLTGPVLIFTIHFCFDIFIDNQYRNAYNVTSLAIGVTILAAVGDFITQTLLALKKSMIILYSSIFITGLNIAIIGYAADQFGLIGINSSLIAVYFINILVRLLYLQKIFGMEVRYIQFLWLIGYFVLACIIYVSNNWFMNLCGLIVSVILIIYFFHKEAMILVRKILNR